MFLDDDYVSSSQPFWFASSELSADLMCAELNTLHQLLTEYPDFRKWFDSPKATLSERKVCFALLAHRKLFQLIDEKRVSMYDDPLSLDDRQLHALSQTSNLVAGDEPAWVREMNEVVERLPPRILAALPEPLHSQSFNTGNPLKDEASRSAAMTLSAVELIQALTEQVIDQQWQRLLRRWPSVAERSMGQEQTSEPKKPKHWLKGTKGLVRKADFSRWMQGMTEKQQLAFSLKYEYEVGPAEIASRMGLDRKTAYEHLEAAKRKVDQIRSGEKRKANRAKNVPE
jgi:hypothetical protein